MQLEDYLDIVSEDCIRVRGHRLGIEDVIERYAEGASVEQIALDLPGLSLEQIHAVLAYYLRHRTALDSYLERINARHRARLEAYDAQPRSPLAERLRALQNEQAFRAA
jgi:uncharacterized protein (DUF433 family)